MEVQKMPKKKKSVRWVIQSLGLLELIHPDDVEDTWKSYFKFGTGNYSPYGTAKHDIKGRIRISVAGEERLDTLKEAAISADTYLTKNFFGGNEVSIMESVVTSSICYNSTFGTILEGKETNHEEKLKPIIYDLTQLVEPVAQIKKS